MKAINIDEPQDVSEDLPPPHMTVTETTPDHSPDRRTAEVSGGDSDTDSIEEAVGGSEWEVLSDELGDSTADDLLEDQDSGTDGDISEDISEVIE